MKEYNPCTSVRYPLLGVKIYAELMGNYENQRIKSLWDNNLGKGAGKTTALTLFLLLESLTGFRKNLFCNYGLKFTFEWLRGHDMVELTNKLIDAAIGIDELHEYADSRNSGTMQNKRVADFFLQSRHTRSNVYYSTQYKDQVDKRIRRITDIDVVCENLFTDLDGDGDDDLFQLTIADRRTPNANGRTMKFYAKPIFDLFDSTERINPFMFTKKQEKKLRETLSEIHETDDLD